MTQTDAMTACIRCRKPFPAAALNVHAEGPVCNLCEVDGGGDELTATSFNKARSAAVAALVANLAAVFVTARETSRTSSSAFGHGKETVTVSIDYLGLPAACLALVFVLGGVVLTLRARGIDGSAEEARAMRVRKAIFLAIFVALAAWAGYELLDALPSTETRTF